MGFVSNVATRIRDILRRDKEQAAVQFAKGTTSPEYPASGYDVLQAYGYDVLSDYLRLEQDLLSRYIDYEEMDDYPEVAAAVNIFSDDASQENTQIKRTIWVTSKDQTIQTMLDDLFHRTLRMDEEIWEIARTLCKYGNDMEEILVNEDGVRGLNFLPPPTVRRIEGPRGELFGFVQDFKGRFGYSPAEFQEILATRSAQIQGKSSGGGSNSGMGGLDKVAALEDWEVMHMRLRSKHRRSIYGYSTLEPGRWIWKRLMLLEDAAMIYRLQRAPERYAFYVDVGDLPPQEALAAVNRVRQQYKKIKFFNPTTGKLDLKYNPIAQDEDFFIPVRKGVQGAKIEVLGAPSWQHMDDIEYFRDKLFAALGVPKAYLAQEEGIGKAALASEDVRFARTVIRIQREIKNGMKKVCRVHLAALNIDPGAIDYEVHMQTPSAIFELAQLEVMNARADLAARMKEFVSYPWMARKIFGMSEDEMGQILQEREVDADRETAIQARSEKTLLDVQMQAQMQAQQGAEAQAGAQGGGGEPGVAGGAAPALPAAGGGGGGAKSAAPNVIHYARDERGLTASRGRFGHGSRASRAHITERDLQPHKETDSEKRVEDRLEKMLKNDHAFRDRLQEIGEILHELKYASRK